MKKLKSMAMSTKSSGNNTNSNNNNNNNNSDCKPDNYHVNAKICRLVEQYPCMYDRSNAHYLKKDVVDQAWVKIAKEMNESIPSCKEKWRNIRTSFARSINVNKVPASANRTKPYYLHEELQFLTHHITPGIPISRRSASASNSNSFHSPAQNDVKGENIEVVVHEESFDSYAAAVQQDDDNDNGDDDEQDDDDEQLGDGNSCTRPPDDESNAATTKTHTPGMLNSKNEITVIQKQQQQQQNVCEIPEDDVVDSVAQNDNNMQQKSFNYASIMPPKKRLRIKENSSVCSMDTFNDVKPVVVWPPNDYDGIFLQGLLPEMKAMTFHQKIDFKRRVYEVLSEIFENAAKTNINAAAAAASTSNGCSRSKCKPATTTTAPSTTNPTPMVDIADLNLLKNFSDILQETSNPLIQAAARQFNALSPIQNMSETSELSNNVNEPSSLSKVGAITRSCTNLKRLRSSTTASYQQSIKQEYDTNENRSNEYSG